MVQYQKRRMAELRKTLENEEILDEFDRVVFESIIDKVIIGGYDEDGTPDTYKLTFVLKGNQTGTVPHSKEHLKRIIQRKVRCHKMKEKLAAIVNEKKETTDNFSDEKMCTLTCDGAENLYSLECPDTCGDGMFISKNRYKTVKRY